MKTNSFSEPELVWEFFERKTHGFFVEVGANEPQVGSQTWLLESKGWHGLLIEPLPHLAERLRAQRLNSRVIQAACGPRTHPESVDFFEAECPGHSGLQKHLVDATERYRAVHRVPMLSLEEILAEAGCPAVDFLSIDVEGMELQVLRGLDFSSCAPALMLVEDHLFSLKTHSHLRRSGYRLLRRTGLNNWYVPRRDQTHQPALFERIKLWRKVWAGTPLRAAKHHFQSR